jgi:hypothetical protein
MPNEGNEAVNDVAMAQARVEWCVLEKQLLGFSVQDLRTMDGNTLPLTTTRPKAFTAAQPNVASLNIKIQRIDPKIASQQVVTNQEQSKLIEMQKKRAAFQDEIEVSSIAPCLLCTSVSHLLFSHLPCQLGELRLEALAYVQSRFDATEESLSPEARAAASQGMCSVCMVKHADVIFVKCGHASMCSTCAQHPAWNGRINNEKGKCPYCTQVSAFIVTRSCT